MRNLSAVIAGFVAFGGVFPSAGHTTTLTPVEFINEFLIETQGENADAVFVQFGADASSPLNFTSNIDPAGYTFSYALAAGSNYEGQSMSLSGSGIFNTVTQTWSLSGAGSLGTNAWTTSGTDLITSADVVYTSHTDFFRKGVKFGDLEDACDVDEVKNTSSCFYTSSDKDGKPIGAPFPGKDPYTVATNSIKWGLSIDGSEFAFAINSTGTTPLSGGIGSFTSVISPVPEPCSLFLAGACLAGLIGSRRMGR